MLLLVSPNSIEEAMTCAAAADYIDIVDVKNTKEGSLGANYPWVITEVRKAVPADKCVSATLGDVPYKPGTVAQAGLGAVVAGASYIKAGLFGCVTPAQAIEVMTGLVRAVKDYNPSAVVVAAGYADAHRVGSLSPLAIPYVAHQSGADVAMVDTAIKDGSSLFTHMTSTDCAEFVQRSHDYGLRAALAGSVKAEHVADLTAIGTDIVGVRGAVCSGGDRDAGTIQEDLIAAFHQVIQASAGAERTVAG
jgi:(5-formylfuran-3-yl)methyl phosphate synthase